MTQAELHRFMIIGGLIGAVPTFAGVLLLGGFSMKVYLIALGIAAYCGLFGALFVRQEVRVNNPALYEPSPREIEGAGQVRGFAGFALGAPAGIAVMASLPGFVPEQARMAVAMVIMMSVMGLLHWYRKIFRVFQYQAALPAIISASLRRGAASAAGVALLAAGIECVESGFQSPGQALAVGVQFGFLIFVFTVMASFAHAGRKQKQDEPGRDDEQP